jgi:hypothetical protein
MSEKICKDSKYLHNLKNDSNKRFVRKQSMFRPYDPTKDNIDTSEIPQNNKTVINQIKRLFGF